MSPSAPSGEPPVTGTPTCYRHPHRETSVRCSRCDRSICPDCMRDAAVGYQCPDCVGEGRRTVRAPRTAFGGRVRGDTGQVTRILVAVNVAVFALSALTGAGLLGTRSFVTDSFGMLPQAVAAGEPYRLFTAMFVHFGLVHIGVNMYALLLLGPQLEQVLGRWRFLALYLLAGLGGTVTSYVASPAFSAGASGAIFGLFGAYFVIARRVGSDTGQIVGLIVINLMLGLFFPGIDVRAHIGGLVAGAAIAAALVYAPGGRRRLPVQLTGVVVVAAALAVAAASRTAALAG